MTAAAAGTAKASTTTAAILIKQQHTDRQRTSDRHLNYTITMKFKKIYHFGMGSSIGDTPPSVTTAFQRLCPTADNRLLIIDQLVICCYALCSRCRITLDELPIKFRMLRKTKQNKKLTLIRKHML